MVLRRRDAGDPAGAPRPAAISKSDRASYPDLVEFLETRVWPDGSVRVTGTLGVFVDEGTLKLRIVDRDQGWVSFVTADTFAGCLKHAQEGLKNDDLDWRVDKFAVGRSKRR